MAARENFAAEVPTRLKNELRQRQRVGDHFDELQPAASLAASSSRIQHRATERRHVNDTVIKSLSGVFFIRATLC